MRDEDKDDERAGGGAAMQGASVPAIWRPPAALSALDVERDPLVVIALARLDSTPAPGGAPFNHPARVPSSRDGVCVQVGEEKELAAVHAVKRTDGKVLDKCIGGRGGFATENMRLDFSSRCANERSH